MKSFDSGVGGAVDESSAAGLPLLRLRLGVARVVLGSDGADLASARAGCSAGEEVGAGSGVDGSVDGGWVVEGSLLGVSLLGVSLLGVSLSGVSLSGVSLLGVVVARGLVARGLVARGRRVVVRRLVRVVGSGAGRAARPAGSGAGVLAAGQGGVAVRGRSTGTARCPVGRRAGDSSGQYRVRRGGPARVAGIGAAGGPVTGQHVAGVDQAADEVRGWDRGRGRGQHELTGGRRAAGGREHLLQALVVAVELGPAVVGPDGRQAGRRRP